MLASTLLSLLPFLAMSSATPQIIPRSSSYTLPVPTSQGNVTYSSAQSISGTFDGELKTYGRGVSCTGQAEGGNSNAVFLLEDGATLKNVIIGEDQIEGVHCLGSCTIENVWWVAVCEDALTFKGDGDGSVIGGGATGAEDKVIQHNGIGDVTIDGFTVVDFFGELYRSCGNCKNNGDTRNVNISNVKAYNGKVIAGINSNYGDVATITDTCATSVKQICTEYEGTSDNDEEPTKLQSGVSDNCVYTESEITTC